VKIEKDKRGKAWYNERINTSIDVKGTGGLLAGQTVSLRI
jgi:hypothetical protein